MTGHEKILERWMNQRDLKALAQNAGPLSLGHLPASAQAFILAALARESPKRTCLAVPPGVKAQEELANDLEAWGARHLFFPQMETATAETLPDPEMAAERLAALSQLASGFTGVVLATARAGDQPLPQPKVLAKQRLKLVKNTHVDRDAILAQLGKAGYTREAQVQGRGQFSVRGAVIDIFSWDARRPLRTEWEDEELISLREFDVDAQRSVQTLKTAEITLAAPGTREDFNAKLRDFFPKDFVEINLGPEEAEEESVACQAGRQPFLFCPRLPARTPWRFHPAGKTARSCSLITCAIGWPEESWEIAIFCNNEGEHKAAGGNSSRNAQLPVEAITFLQRPLLRGFVWPEGKLVVLSDAEIFGRYQTLAIPAAAGATGRFAQSASGARFHRDPRWRLCCPSSPRHWPYIKE